MYIYIDMYMNSYIYICTYIYVYTKSAQFLVYQGREVWTASLNPASRCWANMAHLRHSRPWLWGMRTWDVWSCSCFVWTRLVPIRVPARRERQQVTSPPRCLNCSLDPTYSHDKFPGKNLLVSVFNLVRNLPAGHLSTPAFPANFMIF